MPVPNKPERIQKILSGAQIASRRTAEKLIAEGRVTRNGGRVNLGEKAVPGVDAIEIDGVPVELSSPRVYFALNKPRGVITSTSDPRGRTTVVDLVPENEKQGIRLFPVGRLDMESSGLILLTNDGFLANRLLHPSFEVPREYLVEVTPVPGRRDIAEMRKGVRLEDGDTGAAKVSLVGESHNKAQVSITIHTGRKRQIRRMFSHLGYEVTGLMRVRIGPLRIESLRPGRLRKLTSAEVRRLYEQTGVRPKMADKEG